MRKHICINLPVPLLERIDLIRGDIPRSRMIERALSNQPGLKETSEKVGVEG